MFLNHMVVSPVLIETNLLGLLRVKASGEGLRRLASEQEHRASLPLTSLHVFWVNEIMAGFLRQLESLTLSWEPASGVF